MQFSFCLVEEFSVKETLKLKKFKCIIRQICVSKGRERSVKLNFDIFPTQQFLKVAIKYVSLKFWLHPYY